MQKFSKANLLAAILSIVACAAIGAALNFGCPEFSFACGIGGSFLETLYPMQLGFLAGYLSDRLFDGAPIATYAIFLFLAWVAILAAIRFSKALGAWWKVLAAYVILSFLFTIMAHWALTLVVANAVSGAQPA